ncbi:MAG TPA: glycosyltransferase family 4 protein [Acidimicrobiales bacterium]|jgi:glycosyltransferase involved in cell wall biosynthesis
MNERTTDAKGSIDVPLVLHVIPTARARGAQREARAVADHLESPGRRAHRVLSLFGGPSEVVVDASLGHREGDSAGVGFDPSLVLRLRAALAAMDPEVVVAHGSEPLKYLVPAMLGRRRPLVYYAIGTYSGSTGTRQLRLWKHLAARADVVAAVGEEVRDECIDLLDVPPERVTLALNGRDPEVFHPSEDGAGPTPVAMFVGALTPGKCPDHFVEVVSRLRGKGVSFQAKLVGGGPMAASLIGPAEVAGIEVLGPRSDVADQMRAASVLVFPSRPAGEGMPGVLIEAGLSGLPVVATAVPGVRSIVREGETGLVVPVDDVPAMVSATARLLVDPDLRVAMGRAARKHCCDRFSLDATGERWIAVLQPLLDAGVGRRRAR